MTRQERIAAVVAKVGVVGATEDTGLDEVRDAPRQYLLVERNLGAAADTQSHYLTTHGSLGDAASYHLGNEYPADWEIVFAVDLDTGREYTGKPLHQIQWSPGPAHAPEGDPEFMPHQPEV